MQRLYPVPQALPISELRFNQAALLEKLREESILLTRQGVSCALLVHPDVWNELIYRLKACEEKQVD